MGKATRWLRSLLGSKKPRSSSQSSPAIKDKKNISSNSKWPQTKSSNNNERNPGGAAWSSNEPSPSPFIESLDANKHAIAVAAATAAVAEAALAAAQAAAEVVRLTSASGTRAVSCAYAGGSGSRDWRRELAAVKIQSAFRAYLARRALRALKGLVKLQALVRGRIVRKQSADMLRRMQAMARIQARACANRVPSSESPHSRMKNSKFARARCGSKSSINNNINIGKLHFGSSWLDRWMEESTWNNHFETVKNAPLDDEKSDKILEIDTWKPRYSHRQYQQAATVFDPIAGLSAKLQKPNPSISSEEITSLRSLNFPPQKDQMLPWAAEYSPRVHSASRPGSSSRRGPFTPTSECSRSLCGDYMGQPSYMCNTESSLAKVRSQSAPRQRMATEKLTGRRFVQSLWDADTSSEKGFSPLSNFRSKDRPDTPARSGPVRYRMAYEARH